MNLRATVFALALLAAPTATAADLPREVEAGLNNFSHELINCSVYYLYVAEGMRRLPGEENTKAADQLGEAAEAALDIAMATADSLGQKRETVEARLRIAAADMGEDMGGTYLNTSILIEKYAEVCKLAVDHPEARMDWWIEKAAEDFSSR